MQQMRRSTVAFCRMTARRCCTEAELDRCDQGLNSIRV
jgi:hypothetical protein